MSSKPLSEMIVSLNISAEEYLKRYQGAAKSVYAYTLEGRSIRFPANILQPFVSHQGVRGTFVIRFDQDRRFVDIRAI